MKKYLVILLGTLFSISAASEQLLQDNFNVKEIEIEENVEVPEEVLINMMETKKGRKFSTETLLKDYNSIMNAGYVEELSIFPQIENGGVKIVVQLKEKKDVKQLLSGKGIIPNSEKERYDETLIVSDLEIDGLKNLQAEKMKALVPLKTGGYFTEKQLREGQKALLETGYFRNVEYRLSETSKGVKVYYDVLENPILSGINIIGNTVYTTEELLSVMQTKPGEVFSIKAIQEDRDKIMGKYYDDGYVLSEISDIDITNNLQLEIILSEGIVRNVQYEKMITKQKGARREPTDDILKTKNFVIDREIEIEPEKVFNVNDYDETSKNLMRLGHFKNVKYEASAIPGDPDGRNVTLFFDEDRTASLQGAISYGSETGILGMLEVQDSNWDGRGQNLGISFEKSDTDYSNLSLSFYDPWIKGTDRISWGWDIYKSASEIGNSDLFHTLKTVGIKGNVGKGLNKNLRLSLGTKYEDVKELASNGSETDRYRIWSLYPSITYDTRNHNLSATSGEYVKFQIEGGHAGGYNSDYFGNVTLELRKFHRGFFKNNTMAYRALTGIMTDSTKESQRFWVGGNNLRGYEGGFFQGTQRVLFTVENRTQINDLFGIVFFTDTGRAWKQNGRDPGYTHDALFPKQIGVSAGAGIRLNTPIGPLRFDFGWPVGTKIDDEKGMKFYFNMGHSF